MALRDERAMALVSGLLDEMRTRKIVLPALSTVEGIVVDTLALAEAITFETLCRPLSETQRERLDSLISPAGDDNRTLTWFRYPPGRPTPANFLRLIDRLQGIREMQIPDDGAWRVHQNRLRCLAREGARYTVQHIQRFRRKSVTHCLSRS
jgi:hypothetical protein